ncbi:unnamed protein product [[Candida] boidinii]|nr:unnamed protein product [[Candida] boidinii]
MNRAFVLSHPFINAISLREYFKYALKCGKLINSNKLKIQLTNNTSDVCEITVQNWLKAEVDSTELCGLLKQSHNLEYNSNSGSCASFINLDRSLNSSIFMKLLALDILSKAVFNNSALETSESSPPLLYTFNSNLITSKYTFSEKIRFLSVRSNRYLKKSKYGMDN